MTAHSSLSRQGSSIVAFPSKTAWKRKTPQRLGWATTWTACWRSKTPSWLCLAMSLWSGHRAVKRNSRRKSNTCQSCYDSLWFMTNMKHAKVKRKVYLYLVFWYAKTSMVLYPRQQLWEEPVGRTIGLDDGALVEKVRQNLGCVQGNLRNELVGFDWFLGWMGKLSPFHQQGERTVTLSQWGSARWPPSPGQLLVDLCQLWSGSKERLLWQIFAHFSFSVKPVTRDHFYSINTTQDHKILNHTM